MLRGFILIICGGQVHTSGPLSGRGCSGREPGRFIRIYFTMSADGEDFEDAEEMLGETSSRRISMY